MLCRKKDYLIIEKVQYKAIQIIIVMHHMTNSSYVIISFNSTKAVTHIATKIYKSLADINPDFMKLYLKLKKMLCNLGNGCT